jgi:hypothetical protein
MEMKYIIIKKDGYEQPIVFPTTIDHSYMAKCLGKVVSAGFCSFGEDYSNGQKEVSVWGESVTLNIKPDVKRQERDVMCFEISFEMNRY